MASYRKRGPSNPIQAAFGASPIPRDEMPTQLKTRIWRPDLPGWEDRPEAIEAPHAAVQFRAPLSADDFHAEPIPTLKLEEAE